MRQLSPSKVIMTDSAFIIFPSRKWLVNGVGKKIQIFTINQNFHLKDLYFKSQELGLSFMLPAQLSVSHFAQSFINELN